MPKKKTHEQYVKEVESLNNGIKVVETYIKNGLKILHQCPLGHQWKASPNKILLGQGCPYCCGKRVCIDNCLAIINKKLASEWHPTKNGDLTPYDVTCGSNKKVWWLCKNCLHEWKASINNRSRRNGCPKCCQNGLKPKTHEEFVQEVINIYGENVYEFLTEHRTSEHKIKTLHIKCGYVWDVNPPHLVNKKQKSNPCPYCNHRIPYTTESFKEKVFEIAGNEYTVLGEYINDSTKILMIHNECGHKWNAIPNSFLCGRRCPACNESNGERRIRKWLIENNLLFKSQQPFKGLLGTGGGNLLYDFYLPDENLLIEYQGEFHDGTARQQSKEDFIIQQEHDKRKRQYANENRIRLLEIWYWDFDNIEEILNKKLI